MSQKLKLIKKLYKHVDSINPIYTQGLCDLAYQIFMHNPEKGNKVIRILIKEVRQNSLLNTLKYDKRCLGNTKGYFWRKGEVKPRKEFLEYLIEKYSRK